MRVPGIVLFAAAVSSATAQTGAREAMEAALEKQRASLEKQRASVRAQVPAAHDESSFFTVGWTTPAPVLATAADPGCEPVPEHQIGPLIEEISRREGLTPDLLRAVIRKESNFLPCSISRKGAQGLMQLMPETAADLGVEDPFDPRENVGAGARYLRQLLTRFGGDVALSLGAYNAGPARVDALGRLPDLPETVNFVSDILGKLGQ